MTPYEKAIREANKTLRFKSHKQTKELLEFAADDIVDAYQIGAREAQREIVTRLIILKDKSNDTPGTG